MKDLNKSFEEHEKDGFPHLEEIERKIRLRRRKNRSEVSMPNDTRKSSVDPDNTNYNLASLSKGAKLGGPHHRINRAGKEYTPDELYEKMPRRRSSVHNRSVLSRKDTMIDGERNDDMVQKLSAELVETREEAQMLKVKNQALTDGQMTVDNFELAKQLDMERQDLQKEKLQLLKNYADRNEKLEQEKAKFRNEIERVNAELDSREADLEINDKKLKVDLIELERERNAFENDKNSFGEKFTELERERAALLKENERIYGEDARLHDYEHELDELKQRLLEERERILNDGANSKMGKLELEQQEKQMRAVKVEIEIWKKVQEKDLEDLKLKTQEEVIALEERRNSLFKEQEELEFLKEKCEKQWDEVNRLKQDLDHEN